jgi:hypothetical protein
MQPRPDAPGAPRAAADPVEELVADLQQARAGVRPWPADRFAARGAALAPALAASDMAGFVAELVDGCDVPDIAAAAVDLDADEPGRRTTHRAWRALAYRRLPTLWAWLCRRRATSRPWATWWADDVALPLADDTRARLRDVAAPLPPAGALGAIARRWAAGTGLAEPTAEHNWRWLALGRGLDIAVPAFPALLAALVQTFRDRELLPPGHRVQIIRRPRTPSLVVPIRVPGHSLLSVPEPSPATPLAVQYFQHELGHLAEHALRPADAPLRDRWAFDPVRSEGIALLFELVLRDPRWLVGLGFGARDAERLAGFLVDDEAFTRGLLAADLALDHQLPGHARVEDARAAAAAIAAQLGLAWAAEIMLFRLPAMLDWRSYLAGWAWRDAANAILVHRHGARWPDARAAWRTLRATLQTVGSATEALRCLASA